MEKKNFEVYCSEDGDVIQSMDDNAPVYLQDAEPLEMKECLWFFEDILENIEDAEIEEVDEDTLKVVGEIESATRICDTYVKFIDLAGDGPEYQDTDEVDYELIIDKTENRVDSISFDLSDIAAYVWYGEQFHSTGISDISGRMELEYLSIGDAEHFTIPDTVAAEEEEAGEEQAAEETPAEEQPVEEVPVAEAADSTFEGKWYHLDILGERTGSYIDCELQDFGYVFSEYSPYDSTSYRGGRIISAHSGAGFDIVLQEEKKIVYQSNANNIWDETYTMELLEDGRMKITRNSTTYTESLYEKDEESADRGSEAKAEVEAEVEAEAVEETVDVESEVKQIRAWYNNTQSGLDSLLYTSYDPNLDCYFDGGYPAKVVAKSGYNDWNATREYYYHDQKLYFVFVYGDMGEYRFYVKDGKLIRSISPDGKPVDVGYEVSKEVMDLWKKIVAEEEAFPLMINCGA